LGSRTSRQFWCYYNNQKLANEIFYLLNQLIINFTQRRFLRKLLKTQASENLINLNKQEMKQKLHLIKHALYLLLILFAITTVSAQKQQYTDNPNLDQIPQWYIDQIQNSVKAPSQVITVNDFDNFYLGVDFAESHLSVNPTAPTQFFTAYNIDGTHRTQDGHDWDDATQVPWGTSVNGDPITAYDGAGNLYYESMFGGITGCKVARSTDNGLTWSTVQTAISGGDKNWLAADQTTGPYANYVYTTMTNTSYNGGNFARSTDFGATWTTTFTTSTQTLPGMMVCIGPNGGTDGGSVYVVTNSGSSFASTYTFFRSLNGGATFTQMSAQNFAGYVGTNVNGRNSVENMRTRPYPFISADQSTGTYRGRLYLVYASNWPAGDGNKPDIWCRYSNNGGATWSSTVKVNDDPNTQNNHQWSPAIWCDTYTGRLYVHWMDTRDDPTSSEALMYASYSDDGGASFATNQLLSNEPMVINCSTCGGGGTPRYQGDYTSIVSNGVTSMSTWTDFRDGTFASFAGYFPDYAMSLSISKNSNKGINTVLAEVPDVKLYTDDVIFTASMETPPSGSFSISFPSGNTLSSFPGSIPIQVTDNSVPSGFYTLTVTGKGPNGTPIHTREISIEVVELAPPVADFTADELNPFVGNPVSFTDLSTNAPTSWNWSFNPASVTYLGGTSNTSQNPQVSFDAPGNYTVTLIATNVYGNDSETKVNYINATNCTYCSALSNNATEEWISAVSFNTIDNSLNTTAGYEDFTYISTDVSQGSTYSVTVSCGTTGSWLEYYYIFIDWNSDCDFDDANETYNLGSAYGISTQGTNITIPSGIEAGIKRMRVTLKYNAPPTACETFSFGQVEDYSLNVLPTDVTLDLKAFLEGPFNGTNMDADINGMLPLNQPFNIAPWNYSGGESVGSMPNTNVVEWVLVELRDASSAATATGATVIARQAAFILKDGSVVDLDGSSNLTISASVSNNLYAVLWQRNHIGIMSNFALTESGGSYSYNFTSGINQVYGGSSGHKLFAPGIWGMRGGDGNRDGSINGGDLSPLWELESGTDGYLDSDYTLDGQSDNQDKDDIWVPNNGSGTSVPN